MADQPKPSLVMKLAAVMAAVERIPKRGRNDFHKYDYATEADIASTVRSELASRHVMLLPAIVGESRFPVGEKGSVLTVLEMEMEFLDGETGETLKKPWRGYGTDKEDKGGYKAMTGGEKYFLLKTFLMPTGDDPEAHDEKDKPSQRVANKPAPVEILPAAAASMHVDVGEVGPLVIEKIGLARAGAIGEIFFTNGDALLAYKLPHVKTADTAHARGESVLVTIKKSTSGNRYLADIKSTRMSAADLAATKFNSGEPVTADQIPFALLLALLLPLAGMFA